MRHEVVQVITVELNNLEKDGCKIVLVEKYWQ
jgi:hypothetical protein